MLSACSSESIHVDGLKHAVASTRSRRAACAAVEIPIVYAIDDDPAVRESLHVLLSARRLHAVTFASGAEYRSYTRPESPSCLVLDVRLPDISSLDLNSQGAHEHHPPIVFVTGCDDIASCVRALKAGAVDYLTKPVSAQKLMAAVEAALEQDRIRRRESAEMTSLRLRLSSLTAREREVLALVVGGLLNKQSAARLGITEVTIQVHRSRVMEKMKAKSLADLVRMAGKLSIPFPTLGEIQPYRIPRLDRGKRCHPKELPIARSMRSPSILCETSEP